MADARKHKKAHHPLRIAFRWCRIAVLLLVALVAAAFLWANIFGLPGWVTAEIQQELRQRGIHLEFAKLRLKGFRRIVARDVHLQSLASTNSPRFTVREAEFLVDFNELKQGNITLSGVRLVTGTLLLPVDSANGRSLTVSNITADVLLLPGDALRVANLSAETLGARATLSGEIQRFSKFRFASSGKAGTPGGWQRPLAQILDISDQLQFASPPELSVSVSADGSDVAGTTASIVLRSDEASSPWGKFERLEISSSVRPADTNNAVRGNFLSTIANFHTPLGSLGSLTIAGETLWSRDMEFLRTNSVQFSAQNVDSKWFRSTQVDATLASSQDATNSPIRSTLAISTDAIEAPGVAARTNSFHASLEHPLPFPTPSVWLAHFFAGRALEPDAADTGNRVSGTWQAGFSRVKTTRVDLDSIEVEGSVLLTTNRNSDRNLGPWRFLAGLQAPWQAQITNIHSGEIAVGSVRANGRWEFPRLDLAQLEAELHGGYLKANGALDVTARAVTAKVESRFDYAKAAHLLDKPVQQWIAQFSWDQPPFFESTVHFRLPPWTNSTQLKSELSRTLALAGQFEGAGRFRGVPIDAAQSHFTFSNFVWRLPDLLVRRPEGSAQFDYTGNVTNSDFRCLIESRLDPGVFKTLLPKEQQPALAMVKFAQPPIIDAELAGNWDDTTSMEVRASVAATNFFVKEQAFTDVAGNISITNGIIYCANVIAHRGKEEARTPYLRIDPAGAVMFVTNLVSTIDPWIAMSLVGEDAYNAIDPYRFAVTPIVGVNGIVPLRHWSKADLHFDVAGNEFTFWKFNLPTLAGHVHWRSNEVSFSNVVANFYGGKARWSGRFVIDPRKGEDYALYSFAGSTTNTQIKPLVADLTGRTNQMEGILHGDLIITSASTADDRSWNGHGEAILEDGFLWNVPIFGVFSPVLDGIAPGLGSSRISSGSGTFAISNSVVHTRDMQVRAPAFRLGYKGSVDLDGNLTAIAEAMIFRDAWLVGKLFSTALRPVSKAFEAKISGTLDSPKTELRYVPKFLLAPFRALNAIGNAARKNTPQNPSPSQPQPPTSAPNP